MLKQKKVKRKKHHKRIKSNAMKLLIWGVNAAGIKYKLQSFNEILNKLKPQIWSMQETKLKTNEVLIHNSYGWKLSRNHK